MGFMRVSEVMDYFMAVSEIHGLIGENDLINSLKFGNRNNMKLTLRIYCSAICETEGSFFVETFKNFDVITNIIKYLKYEIKRLSSLLLSHGYH